MKVFHVILSLLLAAGLTSCSSVVVKSDYDPGAIAKEKIDDTVGKILEKYPPQ